VDGLERLCIASERLDVIGHSVEVVFECSARGLDAAFVGLDGAREGSGAAPGLSNTTAGFRTASGCTDIDDNASDFTTGVPGPRNTASPKNPCLVGPPTSKDQCKDGGWQDFNNPAFKNQGNCVSYVATGGKNGGNG
jgi:hypothetical protein